jgi:ribosomal-protein-serine acetyltransferase
MHLTLHPRTDIILRTLTPDDAPTLFHVTREHDAHLREWLPWLDDDTSVADTETYIRGSNARLAQGEGIDLSIWHEGHLVGGIGVYPLDVQHKKTSLAYWLIEQSQGQGIMTATLTTTIDFLFTEKNLHRIEVSCAIGNTKSAALPKKLGFTYEGTTRESEWLYTRFVDMELYSMLAHEWGEKHSRT